MEPDCVVRLARQDQETRLAGESKKKEEEEGEEE